MKYKKEDYKKKEVLTYLLEEGNSPKQISEIFGVHRSTVSAIMKKIGIRWSDYDGGLTYKNKEWLEKKYLELNSATKIAELVKVSPKTITYWRAKHDIPKADSSQSARRYHYNQDFFNKIDTEEKAYWLGFIAADGCIYDRGTGSIRLQIGLSSKDENHLDKFQKSIESKYKIFRNKSKAPDGKIFDSSILYINSTKMCKDLMSLGVGPEKTFKTNIPDIDEKLIKHFIRGMFDGDGCISYYNNGRNYSFEFCSSSKDLIYSLVRLLEDKLKISITKSIQIINPNKNKKYKNFFYKIKVMNIKKNILIYDYLYKDCNFYLDRKYNLVQSFLLKYSSAL